jgi:hypothetical protein
VRVVELQYTIDILRQQEQRQQPNANPPLPNYPIPPPHPPFNRVPHHQPPLPPHNQYFPPPPLPPSELGTTYLKSPLANHLQLVPWASHYRATPPPKYHGNTDRRKFLKSYEATIASVGGDEATLAKCLIISLEDAAANWYSRLPPGCICSWQQLKEKFMLNFQGFQAKLDTEEDFLSCVQKEKDTLPNFYQRFLQLKAQAPEVSDDQVIAQAIKTLRVGPLHNHLVRERPKTVPELYEQLAKFSKSEIQHFCKLEQQRKISKPNEAPKSSLQ